jgi:hypothetical protein
VQFLARRAPVVVARTAVSAHGRDHLRLSKACATASGRCLIGVASTYSIEQEFELWQWCRAGERSRTADLPFTRRLLCLLSYTGEGLRAC